MFYWTQIPHTYAFIENFIEELKQEIDLLKTPKIEAPKETVIPRNQNESYPKYIFNSYESYRFFQVLASQATKPIQLSFIFRQISEQENPQMIVVKDTQFREWFNQQPFELKLEYWTYTYDNAANSDRIWCYSIVKALIFKE